MARVERGDFHFFEGLPLLPNNYTTGNLSCYGFVVQGAPRARSPLPFGGVETFQTTGLTEEIQAIVRLLAHANLG